MKPALLSLSLHRDLDTGEWYLNRVDAEFHNIRNQIRFAAPSPIRFALTEQFADFLSMHLPVRLSPSIVTLDHVWLDGVDLGLNGVRVITQRALSGIQSVTIKVQNYVGKLTSILSPETTTKLGTAIGLQINHPADLKKDGSPALIPGEGRHDVG